MISSFIEFVKNIFSFNAQPAVTRLAILTVCIFIALFTSIKIDAVLKPLELISETWFFEKLNSMSTVIFLFIVALALFQALSLLLVIVFSILNCTFEVFFGALFGMILTAA